MNFKDFLIQEVHFSLDTLPKLDYKNPSHGQAAVIKDGDDWIQYTVSISRTDKKKKKDLLNKLNSATYKIEGFTKVNSEIDFMVVTENL